jgi:hypothetical protein
VKYGHIEMQDAETLKNIYRKFDIYGKQKKLLTVNEMVLIYTLGIWIKENVNGEDIKR